MGTTKLTVIGELMNNSYARARKAWQARRIEGYQELAEIQANLGASYLTLNLDGTQKLPVTLEEMLDFLPRVIPAIQEVTDVPISFDNPNVSFHRKCLEHFDPAKSKGRPILNSISVSRKNIDEMIQIARESDMNIIIMASECRRADGSHGSANTVEDILDTTHSFVRMLRDKAGIANDRIIVDPGLAPIASDTQGLINLCLDSIRAIRSQSDLEGIHISVGLSNFAIGAPKAMHVPLECAFLSLATDAGMDFVLANPEKNVTPMPRNETLVQQLIQILEKGRIQPGESQEDAGFRQLDELMELWSDAN